VAVCDEYLALGCALFAKPFGRLLRCEQLSLVSPQHFAA
jgi:hypothetical protein